MHRRDHTNLASSFNEVGLSYSLIFSYHGQCASLALYFQLKRLQGAAIRSK